MFVDAVHRYLLWASLGAVALAVVLSFVMMRRVLAPLTRMTGITREIAAGNFSVRVPTVTSDEVGQLASAFNRMAESLEKLEAQRRRLMIDVAHELRTPLTNIRGYLEALEDGVLPPSAPTIDLLQKETLRLAQLVEDVLQLARADAARDNLRSDSVDLAELIHEAMAPVAAIFAKKSVTVALHLPPAAPHIVADRDRMARALRNLAENAARYTPQGGTVTVRLDITAQKARIAFCNSAPDVVSEDLPYLFERFYRGEKSRSRDHGGAGIGLSIVKELVTAHGGEVSAFLDAGDLHIRLELPAPSQPV
jgi:signal transduction histidine kinase